MKTITAEKLKSGMMIQINVSPKLCMELEVLDVTIEHGNTVYPDEVVVDFLYVGTRNRATKRFFSTTTLTLAQ